MTYDQTRAIGYLVEIGYFTRAQLDVHPLYSWRAEAYMANQIPPRAARPPKQKPTPQVSSDAGLEALYAYMRPKTPPSTPAPPAVPALPNLDLVPPANLRPVTPTTEFRASTPGWQPAPHVVIGAPDPYGTAKGDALRPASTWASRRTGSGTRGASASWSRRSGASSSPRSTGCATSIPSSAC